MWFYGGMADKESLPTIVGVFRDQAAAEAAVHQLNEADFGAREIGLLAPGQADEPNTLKVEAAGVATGGVLGGVAGVILGAATVGAIPGIGPVLAAGATVPVVVLAATGASAGATMGALFAAAATQDQGLHYVQEVRSGRALVTVTTDRTDQALAALESAGALEVADVGRSDTADKLAEEDPDQT
jgi:hypothetical protein